MEEKNFKFGDYNPKIEKKDLIKEMFNEKLDCLERNIQMIASLIEERNQLSDKAVKDIDEQAMIARGSVYNMEWLFRYKDFHFDSISHDLKKRIAGLEISKIEERIKAWKDMAMLKQILINQMNEMSKAKTRINLFQNIKKND